MCAAVVMVRTGLFVISCFGPPFPWSLALSTFISPRALEPNPAGARNLQVMLDTIVMTDDSCHCDTSLPPSNHHHQFQHHHFHHHGHLHQRLHVHHGYHGHASVHHAHDHDYPKPVIGLEPGRDSNHYQLLFVIIRVITIIINTRLTRSLTLTLSVSVSLSLSLSLCLSHTHPHTPTHTHTHTPTHTRTHTHTHSPTLPSFQGILRYSLIDATEVDSQECCLTPSSIHLEFNLSSLRTRIRKS